MRILTNQGRVVEATAVPDETLVITRLGRVMAASALTTEQIYDDRGRLVTVADLTLT